MAKVAKTHKGKRQNYLAEWRSLDLSFIVREFSVKTVMRLGSKMKALEIQDRSVPLPTRYWNPRPCLDI